MAGDKRSGNKNDLEIDDIVNILLFSFFDIFHEIAHRSSQLLLLRQNF